MDNANFDDVKRELLFVESIFCEVNKALWSNSLKETQKASGTFCLG